MILGYLFTLAYAILLAGLLWTAFVLRKEIYGKLAEDTTPQYIALALIVVAFFVVFSLLHVSPVEQLYFDESIYQGIALNILHAGNALWCQYGTAQFAYCGASQIYHDPVELSFYIAIAFAIFGASVKTAYGLSMLVGAISVFLVFLLGSSLFGRRTGIASAVVFALIPEVMIWSRTQAVPNLIFMMFTVLSFYAYEIYRHKKSSASLAFFLFALGITVYTRIEAAILLPLFAVLIIYESFALNGVGKGIEKLIGKDSTKNIAVIALFVILIVPEIYYIAYEGQSLDYGNGYLCGSQTNATFSLSNFKCNASTNINFFLGKFTSRQYYPAYFSAITTLMAVVGAVLMLLKRVKKGIPLLLLGLWIILFHAFYDAFYAGSVRFGVDVRFMLVIYPAMAILAGFGIAQLSADIPDVLGLSGRRRRNAKWSMIEAAIFVVLIALFAALPFYNALGITTIKPQNMPQEAVPLNYINFVYQNASIVPSNCLVFTFDPDVWAVQNRSSAQIGFLRANNGSFSGFADRFSCFVVDIGYWCTTPMFKTDICKWGLGKNPTLITGVPAPGGGNFSLYYISRNSTQAS